MLKYPTNKDFMLKLRKNEIVLIGVIALLLVIMFVEKSSLEKVSSDLALLSEEKIESEGKYLTQINDLEKYAQDLNSVLSAEQKEKLRLSETLIAEKDKNSELAEKIEDVTDTVETLKKIQETDPELLQKYSKVYFLNEHYEPPTLKQIPSQFSFSVTGQPRYIREDVWPYLEDLLDRALANGMKLRIVSGYRSFDEQASLKSNYTVTYGAGTANQFSADQGYSEHQLGTTVDFTTEALGVNYEQIDATQEFQWLKNNAHKYGFVLSYPEGNSYYQYEPWHWRFVGVDLATRLYREDIHFYDLSQREIDTYIVTLFD